MKVLVACEYSGRVRDAFIRAGHDAISCDLLPSDSDFGPHYEGDVFDLDLVNFDLMVAHPPCTYLTNSGVCHLHTNPDRCHMEQKATCLWLKGLPNLTPTNVVKDEMMLLPKNERERLHYLPPSPDRWKLRSTTYQGIADAMAAQWVGELLEEVA